MIAIIASVEMGDDLRKLPLLRCPDGVVGDDAMTTALRMVGSPPPMMDGPSDLGGRVCPWVLRLQQQ